MNEKDRIDLDQISLTLAKLGYVKENIVEQEATWSRRGDIIDIYPVNNDLPIRIELFGDNIDKIKEFDPVNQRSLDRIKDITVSPISIENIIDNTEEHNGIQDIIANKVNNIDYGNKLPVPISYS